MINSAFLDICSTLLLSKKVKAVDVSKSVLEILSFYEEIVKDIPLLFRDKFELVKLISQKRLEGLEIECCIDDVISLGRFSNFYDYIREKSSENLPEEKLVSYIERLRSRKKLIVIYRNRDSLYNLLTALDEEAFDGIDDLVDKYESLVKSMFIDLMEESRTGSIDSVSEVDFDNDDHSSILQQIISCYDPSKSVTTGYPELDSIMNGGFEPTRIYILGAPSNVGKTNFLINFCLNAALVPTNYVKSFLFITLENLVHENMLRMYCKLFRRTQQETVNLVKSGLDIVSEIKRKLDECNSKLKMKYYPANTISPVDIMMDLDESQEMYGCPVTALYVDYLDLLRSDISSKEQLYRLELALITLSLKTLSIKYNIPTITASQLNRSAYSLFEEASLDNMSESIKKVEHSDWVGLLTEDPSNENIKFLKVGKNRSGPKGFRLAFETNFTYYDVIRVRQTFQSVDMSRENLMRMSENPFQEEPNRTVTVRDGGIRVNSDIDEECFL